MRTKKILRLITAWLILIPLLILTPIFLIIDYLTEDQFILEKSTTADLYRDWQNWAFLSAKK